MRKSNIKAPYLGKCYIVITEVTLSDELLIIGFVRETYKTVQLPPDCILKYILRWYKISMLHYIQYANYHELKKHYAISLKDILSCL